MMLVKMLADLDPTISSKYIIVSLTKFWKQIIFVWKHIEPSFVYAGATKQLQDWNEQEV